MSLVLSPSLSVLLLVATALRCRPARFLRHRPGRNAGSKAILMSDLREEELKLLVPPRTADGETVFRKIHDIYPTVTLRSKPSWQ